jgi:phage terminase small subunit
MKRGQKPTPRGIKLLKGNPGRRPIAPELAFAPGVPDRPAFLDHAARREWDRIVAELGPTRVLVKAEQMVLAGYCCAVSRAVRAERRARRDASQEARAEKAWDAVRKFAAVFGIGPAERSRVPAVSGGGRDTRAAAYFEKRERGSA